MQAATILIPFHKFKIKQLFYFNKLFRFQETK